MQQEFYLTGMKDIFDKCNMCIVVKVIVLDNNVKILLVPFVHHIELQNFLNAPHMTASNSPTSFSSVPQVCSLIIL